MRVTNPPSNPALLVDLATHSKTQDTISSRLSGIFVSPKRTSGLALPTVRISEIANASLVTIQNAYQRSHA